VGTVAIFYLVFCHCGLFHLLLKKDETFVVCWVSKLNGFHSEHNATASLVRAVVGLGLRDCFSAALVVGIAPRCGG